MRNLNDNERLVRSLKSHVEGIYRSTEYLSPQRSLTPLSIESRSRRAAYKILKEISKRPNQLKSDNMLGMMIKRQLERVFNINFDKDECTVLAQRLSQKIRIEIKVVRKYSHLIDQWSAVLLRHDLACLLQVVNFGCQKDDIFYEYSYEALQVLDAVDQTPRILEEQEELATAIKLIFDSSFYENFSLNACKNIAADLIVSLTRRFDKKEFLDSLAIPETTWVNIVID